MEITVMDTSTINTIVHKSKWGYHSCSYEDFMFLKRAHKILLRAYKDAKRWIRWKNKTVYQSSEEPICHREFVELGLHLAGKKCWWGWGFKRYDRQNLYLYTLKLYQTARRPVVNPEDVQFIEIPDNLKKLVDTLEEFYNSKS